MPSIYLVRHGEYDNPRQLLPGRLPMELSVNGKHQAETLRDFFRDKQIATIYSSAVERCKQTALIMGDGTIPITYDQRLLEGQTAYQGYWDQNWHGDGYHFYTHQAELGGESIQDIQRRMIEFWDQVVTPLSQDVIICSHGDPLYLMYRYACGLQPAPDFGRSQTDPPDYLPKGSYMGLTIQGNVVKVTTLPTLL